MATAARAGARVTPLHCDVMARERNGRTDLLPNERAPVATALLCVPQGEAGFICPKA